jgi:hypothetical protein
MHVIGRLSAAGLALAAVSPLMAQKPSADTTKADTSKTAAAQPDTTSAERNSKAAPFAWGDFTWVNGNGRTHASPLATKYFTPEFRADMNVVSDINQPKDHTIDGSSEMGRTNEVQVQQLGIGGDFSYDNVRGRLMTQFGMYSQLTPRNDASPGRGQWNLQDAYRYVSEAYGGYHWNTWNGINLDVGIFLSYIGLFSYYNADNWAYQPSYVSANTPWYFNGARLQTFPSDKLKVELWLINGWQSYGMFNHQPGWGVAVTWRPAERFTIISNNYYGYDDIGEPDRMRIHTDDSFLMKYYDQPLNFLSRSAFSVTVDAGCESGNGVACFNGNPTTNPDQFFLGFMVYNRSWFVHNHYGLTIGGGAINNPGRYLVLLPPINGATAISGTPYFTTNPGQQFQAWDASLTFDWAPDDYVMFRAEADHRESSEPYFVGRGGVTPVGGNQGTAGSFVPGFTPDLVRAEMRFNFALLVKL